MMPENSNIISVVRFFITIAILAVAHVSAVAQSNMSQYDHGTPPQHAAGISPIGSYISADLGTINLGNGSLNFKLPLGNVGGRGVWLPLSLNYTSKMWTASTGKVTVTDPVVSQEPVAWAIYDDQAQAEDFYFKVGPGWSVGAAPYIKVRGVGISPHNNPTTGCTDFTWVFVRLTVVLPDKGEIELRDDQTDGAPTNAQPFGGLGCRTQDSYRGKRWHATDGSGGVFYSDNDNGVVNGDLAGIFIAADGTRYRFANAGSGGNPAGSVYLKNIGRCSQVTDRNGNQVQITYPTANKVIYTDQLDRQTIIEIKDPALAPIVLRVTLPGYNGAQRIYTVRTDTMNLHYRAGINPTLPVINGDNDPIGFGYGWPGPHTTLFGGSYGAFAERIDNRSVVTQITLPDGRTLNFNYNEFGEVAEVQLPTGGKVQYDHQSVPFDSITGVGLPTGNSLNTEVNPAPSQVPCNVKAIDRAVVTRRTYADGVSLEATWSYLYKVAVASGVTNGTTEVKCLSAQGALLMDQKHYFMGAQRFLSNVQGSPDGTGYSLWSTGLERRNELLASNGTTVLSATEMDWSQRAPVSWSTGFASQQTVNDNRVNQERKILDTGSFSRVDTFYDSIIGSQNHVNNPIQVDEYDFDLTLKRRTTTAYMTGSSYTSTGVNTVNLLNLPTQQSVLDGGGVEKARTSYEYDIYVNDGNHAAMVDNGVVTGHNVNFDQTKTARGNVTKITKLVAGASFINTYQRYDTLGNVVSTKDGRGNVTTLSYLDDFGNGSNPGFNTGGHNTYSLPTRITSPPPNGSEAQHVAYTQYDYSTGLLTGFRDRNNVITQTLYNDAFDRPTQIKTALGTTVENHTAMYYAPQSNPFGVLLLNNDALTAKDQTGLDDGSLRSWTKTDGFGRTIESFNGDPQGNTKVATGYDGLGRVTQTSNPFRPTLGESALYTTTAYDLAGRVTTVTTPDGAIVRTEYNGSRVLVTDQASKKRINRMDGLGRLTDVWEVTAADAATESVTFPSHPEIAAGYRSKYSYDVLDDLTQATQQAGTAGTLQTRTYLYDGLKRLTQATNPESGTVINDYDANSNLWHRTDARNITTTFSYDTLNRVVSRSYTGDPQSTPAVSYKYDSQGLPAGAPSFNRGSSTGRLVAVVYGGSSGGSYLGYDQMGRSTVSYQQTDGQNYQMGYGYNLASEKTLDTYPSGRTITTGYDSAGRVNQVNGQKTGEAAKTYASQMSYSAHGALKAMQMGNSKWEHTLFNSRLQVTQIGLGVSSTDSSLLRLDYGLGAATNNGNLLSQTITIGATVINQSYSYDALNRIASASESASWSQAYSYDRWGNRAVTGYVPNTTLTPQSLSAFNAGNNRLAASVYDAAGNQTQDAAGRSFTYDAENRQLTFNGTVGRYSYDGDGRRIKKIDSSGTTVFVYNALGQLAAEYTSGSPAGSGTSYLTGDHLGSTRVVMKSDGSVARYDYLPYGEELGAGVGSRTAGMGYGAVDTTKQKFTSKERDAESGLDYFIARYYSSAQGRFTSVDPSLASAKAVEPQSWNRYCYVSNNPFAFIDPDGKEGIVVSGQPGPHKRRDHFLVNGLDRAKKLAQEFAKNKSGEKVTWFIYNEGGKGGFTDKEVADYKAAGEKAGINVQVVSKQQQIVDYVNNKNGGDSRSSDLVSNFTYIGHATPGDLDIGYVSGGWIDFASSTELAIEDFDPNAFSANSEANLVGGCNTAIAPKGLIFESSAANQMADKVGGKVLASDVTVWYPGGVVSDQELVRHNNGRIVEIKGRGGRKQ